jgi:hypothetical protein
MSFFAMFMLRFRELLNMDEQKSRNAVERALEMAIVEDGVKYGYPGLPSVSNLNTLFPILNSLVGCSNRNMIGLGLSVPNSTKSMEIQLRVCDKGSIFVYPNDKNMAQSILVRGVNTALFRTLALDSQNTIIPAKP